MIPTFFVHAYTFNRTLSVGDSGQDVYELQKILNSDSRTQVAQDGVGSPGNESYYFGQKTKQAVIAFQNLYREQILIPNRLSEGTGFVGKSTLAVLNNIQNKESTNTTFQSADEIIEDIVQNQIKPIINNSSTSTLPEFLISKNIMRADTKIHVGSQKKIKDIDFYLNQNKLEKGCRTDYTCSLKIDNDVKPGTYTLKSDIDSLGSYKITILSDSEENPETKIDVLYLNKQNLIKGRYFSPKMMVYTMFGVYETETKNNSFILEFSKDYVQNATTSTEGLFYVENKNGLRSDVRIIKYEI